VYDKLDHGEISIIDVARRSWANLETICMNTIGFIVSIECVCDLGTSWLAYMEIEQCKYGISVFPTAT
jgi:hypothetical protein